MDRVRLGRVLGRGARMAARTMYDAVDAATSSDPAASSGPAVHTIPLASASSKQPMQASGPSQRSPVQQAVRVAGRVQGSARAARQGVLAPIKRASRAVSLEIAGSFFALFALSFAAAAWRFRGVSPGWGGQRLWAYLALGALFGYFALSSFLRARRISRA